MRASDRHTAPFQSNISPDHRSREIWKDLSTDGTGIPKHGVGATLAPGSDSGSRDLDIGLDGPNGPSMETEMYRDFCRPIREGSQLTLIMDFAIETTKIDYSAWTIIDERRIVPDVDFM